VIINILLSQEMQKNTLANWSPTPFNRESVNFSITEGTFVLWTKVTGERSLLQLQIRMK